MDILQVKNEDGTWTGIPAVVGPAGKDATVNGVNTLTLAQGDNIILNQSGDTITISATGFATQKDIDNSIDLAISNVLKEAF